MKIVKFILLIIIAIGIGALLGYTVNYSNIELNELDLILYALLLTVLLINGKYFYIMFFTKNVNIVDQFINKKKKNRYYALIIASVNKQYDIVENYVESLSSRYNQTIFSINASIQLERKELDKAEKTIQKIKSKNHRNYYLALLALSQGNLILSEEYKAKVRHKGLQYVIDAEAAFVIGNYAEAGRFGNLAISNSAGLQRWVLVKSLEYQKNNSNRQSFF